MPQSSYSLDLSWPEKLGPYNSPFAVWFSQIPLELVLFPLMIGFVAVWRVLYYGYLMGPFARYMLRRGKITERQERRLVESSYKALHYLVTTAWGFALLWPSTSCLWDTNRHWAALPHAMSTSFYFYYLYQGAFYLFSLYAGLFVDVRRNDWIWLIVHHVVTVALIAYAWSWGFVRIGSTVLFLMDINDVLLESSKTTNYLARLPGANALTIVLFSLLTLSWPTTRIVLYWDRVLRSVAFEALPHVDAQGIPHGTYEWPAFFVMLCVIGVLNVYWFVLVLMTAYKIVFVREISDVREDNPDEAATRLRKPKSPAATHQNGNGVSKTANGAGKRRVKHD
jgi:hypothetical protein